MVIVAGFPSPTFAFFHQATKYFVSMQYFLGLRINSKISVLMKTYIKIKIYNCNYYYIIYGL